MDTYKTAVKAWNGSRGRINLAQITDLSAREGATTNDKSGEEES